jgi:hypothetical protein
MIMIADMGGKKKHTIYSRRRTKKTWRMYNSGNDNIKKKKKKDNAQSVYPH